MAARNPNSVLNACATRTSSAWPFSQLQYVYFLDLKLTPALLTLAITVIIFLSWVFGIPVKLPLSYISSPLLLFIEIKTELNITVFCHSAYVYSCPQSHFYTNSLLHLVNTLKSGPLPLWFYPQMRKRCTCHQSLQHWPQLGVPPAPSLGWCQLGRPYPIQQWNDLWSMLPSCHYWSASAELPHNGESMCLASHLHLRPTLWKG